MSRKYGWTKADLPDNRDIMYASIPRAKVVPQVKYLMCPPVVNQTDYGTCVYNAIPTAMEAVMIDEQVRLEMLSRMFGYNDYRLKAGIPLSYDSGASIRDAVKLSAKDGICHESLYPYTDKNFHRKPPAECYKQALTHRVKEYYRLQTIDDMVNCIASGFGFVGGIMVYPSFENSKTGIIPMPGPGEERLGGHALWFWGYDLHLKVIHGQNSWGEDWGNKGRFTIPFQFLSDTGLADDFWTVRR